MGVIDVDICISSHLKKKELAWTVDKRLWVISTVMLCKSIKELRNRNFLNYVAMWPLVTYSNYFV